MTVYLCKAVQLLKLLAEIYSLTARDSFKMTDSLIGSTGTKALFPFLSSFLPPVNFLCASLSWRRETWQAYWCVNASQKLILCCHGDGGCHVYRRCRECISGLHETVILHIEIHMPRLYQPSRGHCAYIHVGHRCMISLHRATHICSKGKLPTLVYNRGMVLSGPLGNFDRRPSCQLHRSTNEYALEKLLCRCCRPLSDWLPKSTSWKSTASIEIYVSCNPFQPILVHIFYSGSILYP